MTMAGSVLRKLLFDADIVVGGNRPWDIQVNDERAFREILFRGSLGLGESYMNGWWNCERLDIFFQRLISSRLDRVGTFMPVSLLRRLWDVFGNDAAYGRSFETGEVHYNLGNDLFAVMLDERMVYTCSYPINDPSDTLDAAQERKLALVCAKLRLARGQRVLDIGCGWGSFAKYAAEHFGVHVTGITISTEQANLARNACRSLPVSIVLRDYRDFRGMETFDRIVSLGMFEHTEHKNHRDYFACVERNLAPGGLFLLHTIMKDRGGTTSDPFIRNYIFPQGMIPGETMLRRTIERSFDVLDWHRLGSWRYARTLRWWHERFLAAWPLLEQKYGTRLDGRFKRMWEYYLLSFVGAFDAGRLDVLQAVIARGPVEGGYAPVRMP